MITSGEERIPGRANSDLTFEVVNLLIIDDTLPAAASFQSSTGIISDKSQIVKSFYATMSQTSEDQSQKFLLLPIHTNLVCNSLLRTSDKNTQSCTVRSFLRFSKASHQTFQDTEIIARFLIGEVFPVEIKF